MSDIKNLIDSEQILSIASQLEDDIRELQQLYEDGRNLESRLYTLSWGTGSDSHRAVIEPLRAYHYRADYGILNEYVEFLRENVAKSDCNNEELKHSENKSSIPPMYFL